MKLLKRMIGIFMLVSLVTVSLYQPAQGHKNHPRNIYHKAWQLVYDTYYEDNFNGVDWKKLEHRYDDRIHTVEDAHKYIKVMLKTLNDPYTRFLDPRAYKDEGADPGLWMYLCAGVYDG